MPFRGSSRARLNARPGKTDVHAAACDGGVHRLGLDGARDALLYLPETYAASERKALVVFLHGAGGAAHHGIELLRWLADRRGFALLAPPSRMRTWDVIEGGYGPDVQFIDAALDVTFRRGAPHADSIAAAGFSDGASYALSLGLANGDLFQAVLAWSPGFFAPPEIEDHPDIFISHGTQDAVLPIENCSRRIAAALKRNGRRVAYREFDGPHTVPPEIEAEGIDLFLGRAGASGSAEPAQDRSGSPIKHPEKLS